MSIKIINITLCIIKIYCISMKVPNWEVYVKLNFELPDPGPDGAVKELRNMVETRKTPDYKGGKKSGEAKSIEPRDLGDHEFAKLDELLPIYDEKLKAWLSIHKI